MAMLLFFIPIKAQQINTYIENIIEQTIAKSNEDLEIESIVSDLEQLLINPLDLNNATLNDLDKLSILNDFQIQSLIDYRNKFGQIISLNELNYMYGFNENTIRLIKPFVYINQREFKDIVSLEKI
jgi:hypothetical protein